MHPCSQCRHNANNEDCTTCPACLGISTTLKTRLTAALRQAVAPYVRTVDDGHINVNRWSQQYRTLVLPGDLILRGDKNSDVKQWKTWATATLDKCLTQIQRGWVMGNHESSQQASDDASKQIPSNNDNNNQHQEECGTLGVHAIIVPAAHVSRPSCVTTASHKNKQNNRKRRWRPTEAQSQGGDPRLHLEWRLAQTQPEGQQSMASQLFTLNQAVHAKISADERQALLAQPLDDASDDTNYTPTPAYDIHVAVWRRPFYVQGAYTKTRRDVSQTPFFVDKDGNDDDDMNEAAMRSETTPKATQNNDDETDKAESNTNDNDKTTSNNNHQGRHKRQRLGVTSVEEEILPTLVKFCGGISPHNNPPSSHHSNTVFGMAKFHASGREDMNVRMLLPREPSPRISGRPFVCQLVDASWMPSAADLKRVVQEINHMPKDSPHDTILAADGLSYGQNPNGVGIAPELCLVPSTAFSQLQAQTEDKVKHYGCLCWSANPLPATDDDLQQALFCNTTFPITLAQRTPLRVLHRRSNIIRQRHVLSCQSRRVDDHYFRLSMSTDAGTCECKYNCRD